MNASHDSSGKKATVPKNQPFGARSADTVVSSRLASLSSVSRLGLPTQRSIFDTTVLSTSASRA